MKPRHISSLIVLFAVFALSGCRTVEEGPASPPDPNAQGQQILRGREPEHAQIPEKNISEGESSLTHKNPDQRIDQPKG